MPTGDLTVQLTGTNATSFQLSATSISSISVSGTGNFTVSPIAGLPVGTYTATVEVSGGNGISEEFYVSFTVTKKDIAVNGGTIATETYDGTDAVTVTGVTFDGIETGDLFVLNTDYSVTSAAFTDVNAGSGRTVRMTVTLKNTTTANNYNLTNGTNYDLTGQSIGKANITVSGGTVASKTYDGTTAATITGLTFGGLAGGESLDINTDYTVSAAFTDPNAGSNKTVRIAVTLLNTPKTGNYNLNVTNFDLTGQSIEKAVPDLEALGVTADLSRAPVRITVPDDVAGLGVITVKYGGSTAIPGSPGTYEVTIDIAEGTNYAAATGIVIGDYIVFPPPSIPRAVIIPQIPGATTDPPAGTYYVDSGEDFVFTLTPDPANSLLTLFVTAGRLFDENGGGVTWTANGDGSYTVRIRQIRENISVSVSFSTGNSVIDGGTQVWAHAGTLYIAAPRDGEARIYTLSGVLMKIIPFAAGETVRTQLPDGFYIVVSGRERYKVMVF
jgi:hypothetical protein